MKNLPKIVAAAALLSITSTAVAGSENRFDRYITSSHENVSQGNGVKVFNLSFGKEKRSFMFSKGVRNSRSFDVFRVFRRGN